MVKPALVVILPLLVTWALHRLKDRLGAPARYYSVIIGSLLLVLGFWKGPVTFLDQVPTLGFALVVTMCLLPPLLLVYSLQALTTASHIPFWVSLPGLLSAIGTLYMFMALLMSRVGYIVG